MMEFNSSPNPTIGVEIELQLIDNSTFDLKNIASKVLSDVDHNKLDGVSSGYDASAVFWSLAAGVVKDPVEVKRFRFELLNYCKLDTEALMKVHLKLRSLAVGYG